MRPVLLSLVLVAAAFAAVAPASAQTVASTRDPVLVATIDARVAEGLILSAADKAAQPDNLHLSLAAANALLAQSFHDQAASVLVGSPNAIATYKGHRYRQAFYSAVAEQYATIGKSPQATIAAHRAARIAGNADFSAP